MDLFQELLIFNEYKLFKKCINIWSNYKNIVKKFKGFSFRSTTVIKSNKKDEEKNSTKFVKM